LPNVDHVHGRVAAVVDEPAQQRGVELRVLAKITSFGISTAEGGAQASRAARVLLPVAFRPAATDWIGYHPWRDAQRPVAAGST
jgi:hypothetical protein